jgi:hypothetical protein
MPPGAGGLIPVSACASAGNFYSAQDKPLWTSDDPDFKEPHLWLWRPCRGYLQPGPKEEHSPSDSVKSCWLLDESICSYSWLWLVLIKSRNCAVIDVSYNHHICMPYHAISPSWICNQTVQLTFRAKLETPSCAASWCYNLMPPQNPSPEWSFLCLLVIL